MISLYPIRLKRELQKKRETPLPTDPINPTKVRKESLSILSFAYNL